jgi:hypothetical protein
MASFRCQLDINDAELCGKALFLDLSVSVFLKGSSMSFRALGMGDFP